jgi:hypothetical protein
MAAKAIIITNTLAFILIGININRYGLLERTFPGHTAHHGVPIN